MAKRDQRGPQKIEAERKQAAQIQEIIQKQTEAALAELAGREGTTGVAFWQAVKDELGVSSQQVGALIAKFVPAAKEPDQNLKERVLSLTGALERLPSTDDLTDECRLLRRAMNKLAKDLEREQFTVKALLKRVDARGVRDWLEKHSCKCCSRHGISDEEFKQVIEEYIGR